LNHETPWHLNFAVSVAPPDIRQDQCYRHASHCIHSEGHGSAPRSSQSGSGCSALVTSLGGLVSCGQSSQWSSSLAVRPQWGPAGTQSCAQEESGREERVTGVRDTP
jgi:hypothetical protein